MICLLEQGRYLITVSINMYIYFNVWYQLLGCMNITSTCIESQKKNYKIAYKCESENNIQNKETWENDQHRKQTCTITAVYSYWNDKLDMTKTRYQQHLNDIRKTVTQFMQNMCTRNYPFLQDNVKNKYFNERRILLNLLKEIQIYDTIRNSVKNSIWDLRKCL
jgi:hypothetical protein